MIGDDLINYLTKLLKIIIKIVICMQNLPFGQEKEDS